LTVNVPFMPMLAWTSHWNGNVPATVNCRHTVCMPGAAERNNAFAGAPGWLSKL
jgi:hypothetical protein